jgi:peptide/nickel transport system permease protein
VRQVIRLIGIRALIFLVTLWAILSLNFLIPRLMPGDPALFLLGGDIDTADPAVVDALRERYGLSQPLSTQYVTYWRNLLHGDLGYSLQRRQDVADAIADKLPWTLLLGGTSLLLATVLGVSLGAWCTWRGRMFETAGLGLAIGLNAMPAFWVGILLLANFASHPGGLPSYGAYTPWASFTPFSSDWLRDVGRHLILPAATLTLALVGDITLITNAALRDVLPEAYLTTAHSKGLRERTVLTRHALRNAMLPLVARIGLMAGLMFGGSTLVEKVFSYPGIGLMLYDAVIARDFPLLQGGLLVIVLAVLVANAAADLLYRLLDPRVRRST